MTDEDQCSILEGFVNLDFPGVLTLTDHVFYGRESLNVSSALTFVEHEHFMGYLRLSGVAHYLSYSWLASHKSLC